MKRIYYGIENFERDMDNLAELIKNGSIRYSSLFGVPRGGIPVAIALSWRLGLPLTIEPQTAGCLVVDDVVDSGTTRIRYNGFDFACLHWKHYAQAEPNFYIYRDVDAWVEYWWEMEEKPAQDAVVRLIEYIGEDPGRQGLRETPVRVIDSYAKLFGGYSMKPEDVIKTFDSPKYDQIVLLKDIEIFSVCEHHMLPFIGKAHVAYIPKGKVIGISKLARIVEIYARRLQIQERLGEEVTACIMEHLKPIGAACIIEAQHLCMQMRGVEKQHSTMITSSLKGVFLEDSGRGLAARNELMTLTQT